MNISISRLLREPLVHFFAIGALLFALDAIRAPAASGAPAAPAAPREDVKREIVVSEALRRRLIEGHQAQNGAPPSDDDVARMIEHWVREEVLYREGLARKLDQDDEIVRGRVASKMGFVLDAQLAVAEPSDDEVRAYFDAHADRWSKGERIDFTHVFFQADDDSANAKAKAKAKADEAQRALAGGADPNGMGDTFSGGRRYRGRKLADLAAQFGDAFVDGLDTQALGTWAVRTSRFGVHVVRVDAHAASGSASFDAAKLDVRHELVEERRQQAFDQAVDALVAKWRVVRP